MRSLRLCSYTRLHCFRVYSRTEEPKPGKSPNQSILSQLTTTLTIRKTYTAHVLAYKIRYMNALRLMTAKIGPRHMISHITIMLMKIILRHVHRLTSLWEDSSVRELLTQVVRHQ
jgi:hypothetical protein